MKLRKTLFLESKNTTEGLAGKEVEEEKAIVIEIGMKEFFLIFAVIVIIAFLIFFLADYFKPRLNLRAEWFSNNTVVISGRVMEGFKPVPWKYIAIQVNDQNGNVVWIDTVRASGDGFFKSVFALKPGASGKFKVYANTDIANEQTEFYVSP